ncbi:MAG TPA: DNA/RNA non-specific endonuclease [Myxococcaceae bacterium]|nr:DNA/RNA non-specific endonuclease [Myxococcaceae bacterium]
MIRQVTTASPLNRASGAGAAAVTPMDIAELEQKFGWAPGGWQDTLLRSADAAGSTTARNDGKVTVAELDKYLSMPQDLKFLTSSAMQRMQANLANAGGSVAVNGFATRWEDTLSKRVDQSGFGNGDGQLNQAELVAYFGAVKAGTQGDTLWMPDQKQAAFGSRVADFTGEKNALAPAGQPVSGTTLMRDYMRILADDQGHMPQWVSYMLTAADIQETPVDVKRTNNFRKDPGYAGSASPTDYTNSGYDRGHMKPADDSPNLEAMRESFLMTNMAPQTPAFNRQVWRTLESKTHELVASSGGKATIMTGSLFLDEKGQPLPAEQRQWIGPDGEKKVAVPTHFFKTVLNQLPNGHMTMYAYLVPNRPDLPTKKAPVLELLEQSKMSVDGLEKLLGYDLYAHLPQTVQARLESQANSVLDVDNAAAGESFSASLLWPDRTPPRPLQAS